MTKPKKKAKKTLASKKASAKKLNPSKKKPKVAAKAKKTKAKLSPKKTKAKKAVVKKNLKPTKPKGTTKKELKKPIKKTVKDEKKEKQIEVKPPVKQQMIKLDGDNKLSVGDYAVYPAHGVGKIESVESKTIMGEKIDFMVINIIDTGMNVLIPLRNVESVGLRPVIKNSKVKEVFDVLRNRKRTVTSSTWNRRYREYMEKIKSGSIFEIAEVLRDLMVLKTNKELSFGERKMLDTAKNLLVKELSVAKQAEEKKVESEIQKIFLETRAL